jgi:Fe-S-cluster-containing hydrogenase component 2/CRP-like cAMP-binding protein
VLRYYREKEVIVRQGESGWTAFYILTSADVLALREAQLQAATRDSEKKAQQYEIAVLRERVERLKDAPADDPLRTAATVYLAVAPSARSRKPAFVRLLNMKGPSLSGPVKNAANQTVYIPIDGPVTVNYDSLKAPLQEGELFGEMSCMYRTPRSGTIVAKRDCYVIEMVRNILDQIQKDPAYKAHADKVYIDRVLDLQVRKLSIFSDLTDDEFKEIRANVELVSVEPGTLICDEGERSDCLYIIRSGLVKVMKNVSSLLGEDDVTKWTTLCTPLREGETKSATPAGKVWALLPKRVQDILRGAQNPELLNGPDRMEIIYGLNDVLANPDLVDAKELKPLLDASPLKEHTKELLDQRQALKKKKQDLPAREARRCNRLLLEAVLPNAIKPLTLQGGPETVLSYCSRGDYLGEIGLMLSQPRTATCIAFGHPNDYGQVELVKLPGRIFWKLVRESPTVKQKLKEEISKRRKHTVQRLLAPVWDDSSQVQVSKQFEDLGLIQGQKLMLIDLERCTRCDECVKACVNTHEDGRSRLFLDGPRFGKYLVPTTCRSCLDPVCMIGCPVGSIHRGDNREIVIEDWCIGCSLCADSCPYGSIVMHDLGIIREHSRGWSFMPASAIVGDRWVKPAYRDAGWVLGEAPFYMNRDFTEELAARRPAAQGKAPDAAINFRYEFTLARDLLKATAEFKLELVSLGPTVTVWLNGEEIQADDKPKRGRREYTLSQKAATEGGSVTKPMALVAGKNVLAVQVAPTANSTEVLLQVRLDEVRHPEVPSQEVEERIAEEITEKLVTHRAVVCDLCSTLYGKVPACVNACPHDAAMRVNARFEFPRG